MTAQAATASISGSSSTTFSASYTPKTTGASTSGFGGVSVDPTSFAYLATQTILSAVSTASNGATKARAEIILGPLPYVIIFGVAGSTLATNTGGTTTILSYQTMVSAIGGTASIWNAVANWLFNNPSVLEADGFASAKKITSDGVSVIDINN